MSIDQRPIILQIQAALKSQRGQQGEVANTLRILESLLYDLPMEIRVVQGNPGKLGPGETLLSSDTKSSQKLQAFLVILETGLAIYIDRK